jgi:hypothetical protein
MAVLEIKAVRYHICVYIYRRGLYLLYEKLNGKQYFHYGMVHD